MTTAKRTKRTTPKLSPALEGLSRRMMLREAEASVALSKGEGQTHFVGDDCPGGHWKEGAMAANVAGAQAMKGHGAKQEDSHDGEGMGVSAVRRVRNKQTGKL